MGKSYALADKPLLDLLKKIRSLYHARLDDHDVRIGVILVWSPLDKAGNSKGGALKGYGDYEAGASVSIVPVKDRLTKKFDVEMLINGDAWAEAAEAERAALLDHELTHIEPTGDTDEIESPVIKMRKEGFMVWGFYEIMQRHGLASAEAKHARQLLEECEKLEIRGFDTHAEACPPMSTSPS